MKTYILTEDDIRILKSKIENKFYKFERQSKTIYEMEHSIIDTINHFINKCSIE